MNLFRRRKLSDLQNEVLQDHSLRRALGPLNLTTLGIGAVIGAGIFVMTGQAAAKYAGPGVVFSFIIAGIACGLAGLCYAEFASMIPVAGSAYTYSYATLGEFVAWIIGWNLILEYMFAASTVAVGWSSYFVSFTKDFHFKFLHDHKQFFEKFIDAPYSYAAPHDAGWNIWQLFTHGWTSTGAVLNVPAMGIVAIITVLLVIGIKESATFNNIIVAIKLTVILTFIAVGVAYINPANWHPFIPPASGGAFGWHGVLSGASFIFFAYIGFDAVSTAAQEAKNPQRDMPIGILASLAICTILYISVALILTGITKYTNLNVGDPIAVAVDSLGPKMAWLGHIIKVGAIAGLSSVILVMMMGQPRIFYSMSKDGLLPPIFGKVHPRFHTPWLATVLTGTFATIMAGLLPLDILGKLVNIGTLLAFAIVCVGIFVLRFTHPEAQRPFRTPLFWLVSPLGAVACFGLMCVLTRDTWARLIVWTAIGLVIYFGYGLSHSKVQKEAASQADQ
jgi:APA family basic amino acid/polyamine antiporter